MAAVAFGLGGQPAIAAERPALTVRDARAAVEKRLDGFSMGFAIEHASIGAHVLVDYAVRGCERVSRRRFTCRARVWCTKARDGSRVAETPWMVARVARTSKGYRVVLGVDQSARRRSIERAGA